MTTLYSLNGRMIDSLELKIMLITKGIKVSNKIYQQFCGKFRIYPDPLMCNCLILPDNIIVQITDIALHMRYLKNVISLESLHNMRYMFQIKTPFRLIVSKSGTPVLLHNDEEVTEVSFPPASKFYEQNTSNGMPFRGNAVLQGLDFLSFQCLWPCDYAIAGYSCQFCYFGGVFERLARKRIPFAPIPTAQDVAEITDYAVRKEKSAKNIQLTGGSTMNEQGECRIICEMLNQIDKVVGLNNISGEVLVYTTPPVKPGEIDKVFNAGATRIACSLEVWDSKLAQIVTPGKCKFAGRHRYLDCLKYVAEKYGPNKACSSFVVGIEPADSFLEGAEYLASKGIVPIASTWIPFGRPVLGHVTAPNLDYYRKIKKGLADIYSNYNIVPPGGVGLNVCVCRDIWNHRDEIDVL